MGEVLIYIVKKSVLEDSIKACKCAENMQIYVELDLAARFKFISCTMYRSDKLVF